MSHTLDYQLARMDLSFVCFLSKKSPTSKRLTNLMNKLANEFDQKIHFIIANTDQNNTLIKIYQLGQPPRFAFFSKGKFRTFYDGESSFNKITEFCNQILYPNITDLKNEFEIFDFQNELPANVIVPKSFDTAKLDNLAHLYAPLVKFGRRLDNDSQELIEFRRPLDHFCTNFSFTDLDKIEANIKGDSVLIENQEYLRVTYKPNLLMVLLNTKDPLHTYRVSKVVAKLKPEFKETLAYHLCDFDTCEKIVNSLGIIRFTVPIFMMSSKKGVEIYQKPTSKPADILNWAKYVLLGIDPNAKAEVVLPKVTAKDFEEKVLDPKLDVILFVASPKMPRYKMGKNTAGKVRSLFEGIDTIKVYEFNPEEQVEGLDIPNTGVPQFSVWPASEEPEGTAFSADSSLPVIMENLVRMILSPVTEEQVNGMVEKLQKMVY